MQSDSFQPGEEVTDPFIWRLFNIQELLHVHGWVLDLHGQLFHVFEQLHLVSLKLLATQVLAEDTLELLGTAYHQVSADIRPLEVRVLLVLSSVELSVA